MGYTLTPELGLRRPVPGTRQPFEPAVYGEDFTTLDTAIGDLRSAVGGVHDADNITEGTLHVDRLPVVPLAKGGTGATTKKAAREALGIFVQSAPMTVANAIDDIRFW